MELTAGKGMVTLSLRATRFLSHRLPASEAAFWVRLDQPALSAIIGDVAGGRYAEIPVLCSIGHRPFRQAIWRLRLLERMKNI